MQLNVETENDIRHMRYRVIAIADFAYDEFKVSSEAKAAALLLGHPDQHVRYRALGILLGLERGDKLPAPPVRRHVDLT